VSWYTSPDRVTRPRIRDCILVFYRALGQPVTRIRTWGFGFLGVLYYHNFACGTRNFAFVRFVVVSVLFVDAIHKIDSYIMPSKCHYAMPLQHILYSGDPSLMGA